LDKEGKKKRKFRATSAYLRNLQQPASSSPIEAISVQMSHRIAVIVALMTAWVAMATPGNAQKAKQQSLRMASSEVRNELLLY
jgi:hypothetical protein